MKDKTEIMSNILKELKSIRISNSLNTAILDKICDKLYENDDEGFFDFVEDLLEKEGLSTKEKTKLHVVKPKELPENLEKLLSNFIKELNKQDIDVSLDDE